MYILKTTKNINNYTNKKTYISNNATCAKHKKIVYVVYSFFGSIQFSRSKNIFKEQLLTYND